MLMSLSSDLPLYKVLDSMTYREYVLRLVFHKEEQVRPSKTDWYLMQIAREVSLVLSSKETRRRVTLSDYKLDFLSRQDSPKSKKQDSKSIWLSAVGVKNCPKKK